MYPIEQLYLGIFLLLVIAFFASWRIWRKVGKGAEKELNKFMQETYKGDDEE